VFNVTLMVMSPLTVLQVYHYGLLLTSSGLDFLTLYLMLH